MKKADKSGAQVALIWGEDEVAAARVTVKPLRDEQATQQTAPISEVHAILTTILDA
jgi:histidyl-tRNA synthetase